MSVFVIMETIGGASKPVATYRSEELALAHCVTLASKLKVGSSGKVEVIKRGARYVSDSVEYTVHMVVDNDL